MIWVLIFSAIAVAGFNEGQKHKKLPPRYWAIKNLNPSDSGFVKSFPVDRRGKRTRQK